MEARRASKRRKVKSSTRKVMSSSKNNMKITAIKSKNSLNEAFINSSFLFPVNI